MANLKSSKTEERTIVSFDYAVKYLLRDKADFGILSGFLSELLKCEVVVDAILESESNKADPDGKTNRVDLKARINGGDIAVFEIQFIRAVDFFGRVLYGVSKAITEQVSSGKLYDVKKVYSVNIAYYDLGAEREYLFFGKFDGFRGVNFKDEVLSFAQARDISSPAGPKVDIHPEYYLILPEMFDEHLRGRFDEWIYILKNSAVRSDFTASGIKEAAAKLDLMKMSPADRKAYENYLENRASVDSVMHTARMEGREEGIAEGRAEGRAEGEAQTQRKIAKKLKIKGGASMLEIAEITGLSEEEIGKL